MKPVFLFLSIFFSCVAVAQQDTSKPHINVKHNAYERYSTIATISAGFGDTYRQNYSLPEGYLKNNTSGFAPIYGKLEYGVSNHISLGATISYDQFSYNFRQSYTGNTGSFTRNQTDNFKLLSGGLSACYHFGYLFHSRVFDPFLGVGISLNNVRYSAYPQGDTSVTRLSHPVTVSLRAGLRYYVSPQCSFFADAGYDKQSIVSVGMSCRFFRTHKRTVREVDSDGDGVPDRTDSCPHVKGLAQFNGCPDSDGDGIPDSKDGCPYVAGPADNNGCPYDSARKATVQLKQVAIPKKVIRFNPATSVVSDSSLVLLDSIVTAAKNNGKLDIAISGYTADGAIQPVSKKTANARAVTIKKYLTDHGIVVTRLVFVKPGVEAHAKKHRELITLTYDLTY
jgi:hypothetical protein